ncbi:Helix-turn-helix domain of resolvase [Rhodococcus erythropolis SK121]|nr:Helix-turn-helix domain of resolvase [Rhodococcus erythropolis SK121]
MTQKSPVSPRSMRPRSCVVEGSTSTVDSGSPPSAREDAFTALTEAIDTTTSGGKLIFSIFGALAEFERNLIRERTQVGLAAARARGRTGGRPPKMTSTKLAQAQRMRENGMHLTDIAEIIGVGRTTLYRHLK